MNRVLQTANFLGLCAVAILCAIQWQSIARIDVDRDRLELVRQSQAKQIDQQAKTISDQASDLEDFRKRLTLAEDQLKDLQQKLNDAIAERDQLREALPKWKAAVASRDAAIKKASMEIESLANQRDSAIAQFNDVAVKYNNLVKKASR